MLASSLRLDRCVTGALAIMTSVDFTITTTASPGARSRSAAASLVMAAVSGWPSPSTALTVDITSPWWTAMTVAAELVAGAEAQLRAAPTRGARPGGGPGRGSGARPGRSRGATGRRGRRRRVRRGERVDRGSNSACWAASSCSLSRPARSPQASLTSSSVRTSRRCSTGASSHRLATRRPAAVGGEHDPVAAAARGWPVRVTRPFRPGRRRPGR